jgi:hypothetical protein
MMHMRIPSFIHRCEASPKNDAHADSFFHSPVRRFNDILFFFSFFSLHGIRTCGTMRRVFLISN